MEYSIEVGCYRDNVFCVGSTLYIEAVNDEEIILNATERINCLLKGYRGYSYIDLKITNENGGKIVRNEIFN